MHLRGHYGFTGTDELGGLLMVAKLAFVMAASHSGSTLLAMLLGSHPQATTIGDTAGTSQRKDLDYRCSCGLQARMCPFWLRVRDQMASQGFGLDIGDFGTRFEYPQSRFVNRVLGAEHRGPVLEAIRDGVLRLSLGWQREFQAIAERNVALMRTVIELCNSEVLIDSSKVPQRLKFLLRIPELDVKVIHLVRDGRGVAHTCIRDEGWSAEKSAFEWRRGIMAEENLLARLDREKWAQVRYEDLCSNPRVELERLCTFLGIDPARVNLDFRSTGLHVFGNKMRLSSDGTVRLDDRWRTELTESQISTIESSAEAQFIRYGYSIHRT